MSRRPGRLAARLAVVATAVAVPLASVALLAGSPAQAAASPVQVLLGNNPVVAQINADYAVDSDSGSLYNLETNLGVRNAWASGYTGKGVGIALIDSGVSHVAGLTGVVDGADLSSTSGSKTAGSDGYGHGTHMAGIIAGHDGTATGTALANSPVDSFEGVAPDSTLINIKVAEADGWSDPSRVIAGIAWAIQNRKAKNIRVINLSYGTDGTQGYQSDPLAYAVEQAWKAGIVVVAAAGNNGTTPGMLADPAIDPYVIAVGASASTSIAGGIAAFSQQGNGTRNPDVVAPGVMVQSLRAPGSTLEQQFATDTSANARFLHGSGTSHSTAIVTGMVALMLQKDATLTPDQVKAMLGAGASSLINVAAKLQGHGLVQPVTAMTKQVTAAQAAQTFAASTASGTLDATRGSGSWIAAGATKALAENSALAGGSTGDTWANRAWSGRSWAGSTWAANGQQSKLVAAEGRSWAGRHWA
jgi:serine protease AprX